MVTPMVTALPFFLRVVAVVDYVMVHFTGGTRFCVYFDMQEPEHARVSVYLDTEELEHTRTKVMKQATAVSMAAFGDGAPDNLLTSCVLDEPLWLLDVANAVVAVHLIGR